MKEEIICCDNTDCGNGKYFYKCKNNHDICSLCMIEVEECWDGTRKNVCPLCFEKAKLK